ncbi:MAG: cation:proton antiporter [Pseudomonadota bacterium]|nr:cation:proton antiporter [Pseudomonadota bacterium]
MDVYLAIAYSLVGACACALVSYRFKRSQTSLFIFCLACLVGLVEALIHRFLGIDLISQTTIMITPSYFPSVVIEGLLSYLLFAGCIHIDTQVFRRQLLPILMLALLGTLLAVSLNALGLWALSFGIEVPFGWLECLLLSAAISPTDPVAVLSLLKTVRVPHSTSVIIAGESLLNDGVALVIFTLLKKFLTVQTSQVTNIVTTFVYGLLTEVLGTCLLGLGGYVLYRILVKQSRYANNTDKYMVLSSLMMVNILYIIAKTIHLSAPLSIVFFGLFASRIIQEMAVSSRQKLFAFWDMVDELLNAILFFMIGLEVLFLMTLPWARWLILAIVVLVVFSRYLSVYLPLWLSYGKNLNMKMVNLVSLSGLKGALSLAMVISLYGHTPAAQIMLQYAFVIVAFTIVCQGSFFEWLLTQQYKK